MHSYFGSLILGFNDMPTCQRRFLPLTHADLGPKGTAFVRPRCLIHELLKHRPRDSARVKSYFDSTRLDSRAEPNTG
jgi:hypothetical protein